MILEIPRKEAPLFPFLAGALAGASEVSLTYPLECIKTLMQVHVSRYKGFVNCARTVFTERGIYGFYYGLSSHLLFAFPRVGVRFGVFDACKYYATSGMDKSKSPTRDQMFVVGLLSGFAEASLCTVPLTTLAVRLCAESAAPSPRFTSLFPAISFIVREEGLRGLYRGASPTLLKVTTQIAARFSLYNELYPLLTHSLGSDSASLVAGGTAGGITVILNHPLDVIKSRIQALPSGTYTSSLHCLRVVVQESGYRGLLVGIVPRFLRVVAETSLTFFFYERYSSFLNSHLGLLSSAPA